MEGNDPYSICINEVFNSISHTVNSLQDSLKYEPKEEAGKRFREGMEQLRKMISCYMDGQEILFDKVRNCF